MAVGLFDNPRCDDCGRYSVLHSGASSAMIFDFVNMCPSHERLRCAACTKKLGPVHSNARPADGDMTPYESVMTDHTAVQGET